MAHSRPVVSRPSPGDVQGWIVRGYHTNDPEVREHVRHIVATIQDGRVVRTLLRAQTNGSNGVTQIQSAVFGPHKPSATLNVGFTHSGLAALGTPAATLASFPRDYRMGAASRAKKLGDIGASAPDQWDRGMNDVDRVHIVWTIHGSSTTDLDRVTDELDSALGPATTVVATYDGQALEGNRVHFGYVDSISQPRIEGFVRPDEPPDQQPVSPLGAFFAGHESQFEGITFDLAQPAEFSANGTYNAFRVLEQDVFGFERFLVDAAASSGCDPEWIAAKLCGRWRNGNPLALAPDTMGQPLDRELLNDYGYDDVDGSVCPMGSHMRRANPRNAAIVQRASNHTRRLIRRGTPYGDDIKPGQAPDDTPRGLLGNFFCASITSQFEGVMYDWVNLGLQHPSITGTNDPLLGANDPATSRFVIPVRDGADIVLSGFPRFIRTRASAYTLIPTLTGLRWLAALRPSSP